MSSSPRERSPSRGRDWRRRFDYNKAVCIANATRLQEALDKESYAKRSRKTNIFELLQECHRLEDVVQIPDRASDETTSLTRTAAPYPKRIHVWNNFTFVGDDTWDMLSEEGAFHYKREFPSLAEMDITRETIDSVTSAKGVYDFRHKTAHRYIQKIWHKAMEDKIIQKLLGAKLPNGVIDGAFFPVSKLSFKVERDADHCLVFLEVGRQRFPLFVILNVAPQHLSIDDIEEGIEEYEVNPLVVLAQGETKDPFLAALVRTYGHMIKNGVWRGVIDTAETAVFLKVSKKSPQILKVYHHEPEDDEASDPDAPDIRHTVVGEYVALVLSSIKDKAPTQQWWQIANKLDKCRVNVFSVTRRTNPFELHQTRRANLHAIAQTPRIGNYSTDWFCTTKCLSGMRNASELDPDCTNVRQHGDVRHRLDARQFMRKLRNQLLMPTPESELQPLHISGKHHMYLRGVLEGHGYTFLAKVAERGHEKKLIEEHRAYEKMRPLQGTFIPICVGLQDVKAGFGNPLIYNGREYEKVMILSWEGFPLSHVFNEDDSKWVAERRKTFLQQMRQEMRKEGIEKVVNPGVRDFVWNVERQCLILVNF